MEDLFIGLHLLHRFADLPEKQKDKVVAMLLGKLTAMNQYKSCEPVTQELLISLDMYLEEAEQ